MKPLRILRNAALWLAIGVGVSAASTPFDGALPSALCAGWRGERACELLHEDDMIRVLRCTFPPGVGHEPHYHPPHFGYVLEGAGVMRNATPDGVADRPLQVGGFFSSDAEVRHDALNVGDVTMRFLIIEKKYADTRAPASIAPGLCAAP